MDNSKKPKLNIISFIIGLLVGAIISTGSIYFYTLTTNTNSNGGDMQQSMQQMPSTPPDGVNGGGNMNMPTGERPTDNMRQNQ